MYNHIGHLAEGQHALAKSLFLGGVTRRFPELRFAFLEGGVAWAAALYADLVGHWEKRNREAMAHLDPAGIDRALLVELVAHHAPQGRARPRPRRPPPPHRGPGHARRVRGLRHRAAPRTSPSSSCRRFFFGCEADDPMSRMAFDTAVNPFGARLKAMFGSDIAHWDVPDMADVLCEAHETGRARPHRRGRLPGLRLHQPGALLHRREPRFFEGTVVADVAVTPTSNAGRS